MRQAYTKDGTEFLLKLFEALKKGEVCAVLLLFLFFLSLLVVSLK